MNCAGLSYTNLFTSNKRHIIICQETNIHCPLASFELWCTMLSSNIKLRIIYTHEEALHLYQGGPSYATPHAAGLDLRACIDSQFLTINSHSRALIPSGIAVEPLADNVAGFVYSRSGLGAKRGLAVAQGVGVIDNDYRGEIMIMLVNTSNEDQTIQKGDRIAQLVYKPVLRAEIEICQTLNPTVRGHGGFGHTGKT